MNGTLNVILKILAFADANSQTNSNPRLKSADWHRDISGVPVHDPKTDPYTIAANSSRSIFSGIRTTTIDGTTSFDVQTSSLDPSRYRIVYNSGTLPGLRTSRVLTVSGTTQTWVVNNNSTVTVTTTGSFASVVVGDEIFVPGVTTGDSPTPMNSINTGYWLVLGKSSSTSITLVKMAGDTFQAFAQVVTLTADSQFRAYSAAGVQVGDHVDITAGFSVSNRKNFEIVAVTDNFFEIVSTVPLAVESAVIPTAGGIVFYSENKSFVYVESDQDVAVQVNGDTGTLQRLSPSDPSNPNWPGQYLRRGPTWSLSIVNLSTSPANVLIIHCE